MAKSTTHIRIEKDLHEFLKKKVEEDEEKTMSEVIEEALFGGERGQVVF